MATTALISEQEYLRMSFEGPEPEFVDGVLVERGMPNTVHSRAHKRLFKALMRWDDAGTLFSYSEIRLRLAPGRFRVADLACFTTDPTAVIPEIAPYAVIEIVSPDDRYEEIMEKLADYERVGIAFILLADPPQRRLSLYRDESLISVSALEMPEFGVAIPIDTIFA